MRNKIIHITIVVIIAFSTFSCISTKKVPEGQSLLYENYFVVNNTDKNISRGDFRLLLKQPAQPKFLGLTTGLWMYSSINDSAHNWVARTLRKIGTPPVIFDSTYVTQSVKQFELYLNSKGHFEPEISYSYKSKKNKKIKTVQYKINTGSFYTIRNIRLISHDDSLAPYLKTWEQQTLLRKGNSYDISVLDNERLRIVALLQNQGFFAFSKTYVGFNIDSSLQNNQMDVDVIINKKQIQNGDSVAEEESHKKYIINNVYIYPDVNMSNNMYHEKVDTTVFFTAIKGSDSLNYKYLFIHHDPLEIKPYAITTKLLLNPGEIITKYDLDQTYSNLVDMKVFRYAHISTIEHPRNPNDSSENNYIDCRVDLIASKKHTSSLETEMSTSSGEYGVAGNISYQNKNIFGGAEIFKIRLRGALDLQKTFDDDKYEGFKLMPSYELALDANIEIPRFIAPISLERFSSSFRPKTIFSIGYTYQNKLGDYKRTMINSSFGYSWKKLKSSYHYFPIETNIVNIFPTASFQQQIDEMSKTTPRLKYQYDDHFIMDSRLTYAYNGQTSNLNKSFNFLRTSLETAGNLLYLGSSVVGATKNVNEFYELFGLAYAQYIRFEVDLKHQFTIKRDYAFVLRSLIGATLPYGNSNTVPYEKGFFGGGSNNLRAWPLYYLGPGSYNADNSSSMERVGDNTFVINGEYRFPIYKILKSALFVDAGNIWLNKPTEQYPGGEFKINTFLSDFAVGTGFGIRLDFDFFLIRFDFAIPVRDPAKPENERWVFSKLQFDQFVLNFGIGYPF